VKLEVIPWQMAASPVERTLREQLEADGYDVWAWRDAPGADYQPHSHDHDESIWLVDGAITFGVGGRDYRLGPGDRLMLPRGTVHTARAGSAGAAYLIGERRG